MLKAKIDKHISWHCGRHSFGTNLIAHGVDVSIASKLLGHTSLANTQRYVSVNDEMKALAISKFPLFSSN
jgi:site-specific recombinase XerD